MSIFSNFHHYKCIIMSKFNLKNHWKEILIAILIGLLIWVSSADRPTTIGSTDTICHTDTIIQTVPGATLIRYQKVKLPVYVYDTNVVNIIKDRKVLDTAWLYTDVPVNEYKDSSYYIRTIGWMDSISVVRTKCVQNIVKEPWSRSVTIFGNTQLGNGVVAPGMSISVRRLQLGYNYNVLNQSGVVTVGYRIN